MLWSKVSIKSMELNNSMSKVNVKRRRKSARRIMTERWRCFANTNTGPVFVESKAIQNNNPDYCTGAVLAEEQSVAEYIAHARLVHICTSSTAP